jgi:hypothetical protein
MAEHNNIHNYNDDEYYYCPRNDCPCHDAPAGTLHVHLVSNDPSDLYSRAINYYDQLFGTYDQPRIADLDDYDPAYLVAYLDAYLRARANHPTNHRPDTE